MSQRNHLLKAILVAAAALFIFVSPSAFVVGQVPSPREVVTEAKRKLIPGGPGQKPFDVTCHSIPIIEIQGGGPPRDGIPALVNPKFVTAAAARFLKKDDRVLGVFFNGQAKAYAVRILNWHEVVNDVVGGRPVLVSW